MSRKPIEEWSQEEVLAFLEKEEQRKQRRKTYHSSHGRETLREKIARDPQAYLTRRRDYEEAERLGIDTSRLPQLNDLARGKKGDE